ncbi:MAG: hypothetical protein E6J14_09810 [Chloroflexi bacterium]|nr:MAG: hypothetical protein E6J14_09810 [Chloroflexota bacterium]
MTVPDDELEAQLAHLDALEERQTRSVGAIEPDFGPPSPGAVWSLGLADPPPPDAGGSLLSYIAWLDAACALLASRVATSRDELARFTSQWSHMVRGLARFRVDEVVTVVEGQARARERIAADEAVHLVLGAERQRLAWLEATRRGEEVEVEDADVESGHPWGSGR